jgi:hypothetical protein
VANETESVTRLQRETNEALGRLVAELRETQQSQDRQTTPGANSESAQPLREVSDALGRTTGAMQQLTEGLGANAGALSRAAEALSQGGQGIAGALANGIGGGGGLGLGSIMRSGFGLAPLAGALAGLFRGGGREEAPVFESFNPPAPIRLEAGLTGSGTLSEVVRGTGDAVRVVESRSVAPQVVVNVSAMDSQSFLTRSHDIARAVRDAMLHMDPLNDVIDEL